MVSNKGRIQLVFKDKKRLLKQRGLEQSYISVCILKKNYRVHRLVAETFLNPESSEHVLVNHKDGVKSNNLLENLEWVTHQGNSIDRYQRNSLKLQNDQKNNLNSYFHLNLSKEEFDKQEWKVIPLLDNSFFASNKGMVKRIIYNKDGSIKKEYFKLAERTPLGYFVCRLSNGSPNTKNLKQVYRGIHTLVALAWLENPFNKNTVNHKDKNPANNRLENLEWATQLEQNYHKNNN